jgi:hypothetical protein
MSVSLYGSGQTVIQVVQGSLTSAFSTSSASYVSTGLSATITPQSSTSKILILVSGVVYLSTYPVSAFATVYRGATNLGSGTNNNLVQLFTYGQSQAGTTNFSVIDSPATTSATTYTVYMQGGGSSITFGLNNTPCYIQLLEISGS